MDKVALSLPSYSKPCVQTDVKLEYRMLAALAKTSDKYGNAAMAVLADAHNQLCDLSVKKKRTLEVVYNDPNLGGGGLETVKKKLLKTRHYCVNPKISFGKLQCQRLLPEGHVGKCPSCESNEWFETINGSRRGLSTDHFIDLGEAYRITFETTDLAQR